MQRGELRFDAASAVCVIGGGSLTPVALCQVECMSIRLTSSSQMRDAHMTLHFSNRRCGSVQNPIRMVRVVRVELTTKYPQKQVGWQRRTQQRPCRLWASVLIQACQLLVSIWWHPWLR
jgi:hypothetical protein